MLVSRILYFYRTLSQLIYLKISSNLGSKAIGVHNGKMSIVYQRVGKVKVGEGIEMKATTVPFCGYPMGLVKGRLNFVCHRGKDRDMAKKRKTLIKQQEKRRVCQK